MHGAERNRAAGREGAFISLKEKRADASIAVARIAQCRGADGEIVEDRMALQWWQALQLPRQ